VFFKPVLGIKMTP